MTNTVDAPSSVIWLATQNYSVSQLVKNACTVHDIRVVVESDPRVVNHLLKSSEELPTALVVDEHYRTHNMTGIQLAGQLKERAGKNAIVAMILESVSIDKRLLLQHKPIDLYLTETLTAKEALQLLQALHLHKAPSRYKALIAGRKEDGLDLWRGHLENMGMTVHMLHTGEHIIRCLEQEKPDILLIDEKLPGFDAIELVSCLRSDVRFRDLVIILCVQRISKKRLQECLQAGCDDVLERDERFELVQIHIQSLAKRVQEGNKRLEGSSTTDWLDSEEFVSRCERIISFFHATRAQLAFVYVRLESVTGAPTSSAEATALSSIVHSHFTKALLKGYMEAGCYALLLRGISQGEIQETLFRIRDTLITGGNNNIDYRLHAGGCVFSAFQGTITTVLDQTLNALQYAEDRNLLLHTHRVTDSTTAKHLKYQVLLIDNDKNLLETLQIAFERQGFEVVPLNSVQEALAYFNKQKEFGRRSMIVLERLFEDMDGVELLTRIQSKFVQPVNAVFLSYLSAEKDMVTGIEAGALDYMAKPFHIDLLLEKIKVLLSRL